MPELDKNARSSHSPSAMVAGIAAFVTWGLIPGYWKLFKDVPAIQILAHRFLWTTIFLTLWLSWQRRWAEVKSNVTSRRAALFCLGSGAAISVNWFTFIWAVNVNRITETSLGYFMIPLVNVLFGAIFLRERLDRWQLVSVLLATAAVLNLTLGYGRFPWVAMSLCVSFGLYGLLRKQSGTAAIPGLFLETVLLVPLAIAYLLFLKTRGNLVMGQSYSLMILLTTTGVVTALPLVWFGHAARYLPLTIVGFLQYVSPTASLCLAVFFYHEPFTRGHLISFGLIWIALGVFSFDLLTRWRSARSRKTAEEAIATAAAAADCR